jgi:hypothetical protein
LLQAAVPERRLHFELLQQVSVTRPSCQRSVHSVVRVHRVPSSSWGFWLTKGECTAWHVVYCRCAELYRYLLDFGQDHWHYQLRVKFCHGICADCLRICARWVHAALCLGRLACSCLSHTETEGWVSGSCINFAMLIWWRDVDIACACHHCQAQETVPAKDAQPAWRAGARACLQVQLLMRTVHHYLQADHCLASGAGLPN